MEQQQVIKLITDIPSLIDVPVIDELIDYVSGWIDDSEIELGEIDQQVSQRRLALIEQHGKVNMAERHLEVEEIYIKQQEVERRIRRLKSVRSNLKRRYEVITKNLLTKHF